MTLSPTVNILKLLHLFDTTPHKDYRRRDLSDETLREVEAAVASNLAELDALRRDTIGEIDLRLFILVPLFAAIGAVWGSLGAKGGPAQSAWYGLLGVVLAWYAAYSGPQKAYRKAYKSKILPHLAERFGDLTYRFAEKPDFRHLVKLGVLPGYGKSLIEDEISGTYRGIRITIVEAKLETGGKNSTVVFNGLVVALEFPGRFSGTTVVTKDTGLGAAQDLFGPSGLQRVRLEDPRFEARYQVYGSDQIAARALLTPAIMERVMALEGAGSDPPRLAAEPGMLWVTIPKHKAENLFEPPALSQPVTSAGEMLTELSHDLGSVLAFVDTVLELDPLHAPATVP